MQIVIDIPEVFYEALRNTDEIISGQRSGKTLMSVIFNAVANGTPLPKGHGELKDVSKFHYVTMLSQNPKTGKHKHITVVRAQEINKAPIIIEADEVKE